MENLKNKKTLLISSTFLEDKFKKLELQLLEKTELFHTIIQCLLLNNSNQLPTITHSLTSKRSKSILENNIAKIISNLKLS